MALRGPDTTTLKGTIYNPLSIPFEKEEPVHTLLQKRWCSLWQRFFTLRRGRWGRRAERESSAERVIAANQELDDNSSKARLLTRKK